MSNKQNYDMYEADILQEDIVKQYEKHGIKIKITAHWFDRGRYCFEAKLKGNTRESHLRARAPDVQLNLKLPLFQVVRQGLTLYLIVSRDEVKYHQLPMVLESKKYRKQAKNMWLPYVIGYDAFGELIIADLDNFPHLLLGGSTGSGKSVGLQAAIISIAYSEPSNVVNFILIDVGATSLIPFQELPHLSCPLVRDRGGAMCAVTALSAEMERRIELEYTDPSSYERLPRLVLVIDEFQSLFTGMEKTTAKAMSDMLSSFLQRGRHAKIHLILAAQNPTFQNIKVDLSNVTARVAFKCAKENFSKTILGEGGAERLSGNGDMLLMIPGNDGLQRLQGIYIKPGELGEVVQQIRDDPWYSDKQGQKFVIPEGALVPADTTDNCGAAYRLPCTPVAPKPSGAEQLLASVVLWAIGQDSVSVNALMKKFHVGNSKACRIMEKLEELGVVAKLEAKLPRGVVPSEFGDIPSDMLEFLQQNGVTSEAVAQAFATKNDLPLVTEGEQHE